MQAEKLSLNHQELIQGQLQHMHTLISEYTFANLYLFRDLHHYEVLWEPAPFIKGISRDKRPYVMPLVPLTSSIYQLYLEYWGNTHSLFPIDAEWLSEIKKEGMKASYNLNNSDYLFRIEKLKFYAGRHLDNKRHLVKQLLRIYKVDIVALNQGNLKEALFILNEWQRNSSLEKDKTDYKPCLEALELLDTLNLVGLICSVDKEPSGFLIGEKRESSFIIHFAKARHDIKGIYQHLYQSLALSLGNQVAWINFEQDLGIPALRTAKSSYQPDEMIHKWCIKHS